MGILYGELLVKTRWYRVLPMAITRAIHEFFSWSFCSQYGLLGVYTVYPISDTPKWYAGGWFGIMDFYDFPFSWEKSSQLTFIFFRGVGQPPTRYGICHKILIFP